MKKIDRGGILVVITIITMVIASIGAVAVQQALEHTNSQATFTDFDHILFTI